MITTVLHNVRWLIVILHEITWNDHCKWGPDFKYLYSLNKGDDKKKDLYLIHPLGRDLVQHIVEHPQYTKEKKESKITCGSRWVDGVS